MLNMMQYLGELINAQFDQKKPSNIPTGIDFEELAAIAHRNQMDYLILGALLKLDISEEEKSTIRPFVKKNALKSMGQLYCLKELEERFEEEGIYHMDLKGSVLKRLYPSPEMREMGDIDIMIYDENLNRAKKILQEIGFSLHKSIEYHDTYVKAPFLIIELHSELYDKDHDEGLYAYFKNERNLIAKQGKKYALRFNAEDFYVYMIAHMAKHFYNSGCGIRNLVDVYCYRRIYEGNWDEGVVTRELQICGLGTFENRIRTLAQVWLERQNPDMFSVSLFHYMLDCGTYGKWENKIVREHSKQNKKNKNEEYDFKWSFYFPTQAYMSSKYPLIKRYPYLIVIGWGLRAICGLCSKKGRERRRRILVIGNGHFHKIADIHKGMQLQFVKE